MKFKHAEIFERGDNLKKILDRLVKDKAYRDLILVPIVFTIVSTVAFRNEYFYRENKIISIIAIYLIMAILSFMKYRQIMHK